MSESQPDKAAAPEQHSRRLAIGTLVQQVSQAVGVVAALVVATILGRRFSLAQFGVYGLTLSLSLYLAFALGSMEPATIHAIAEADDREAKNEAFTMVIVVYAVLGLVAAVVMASAGTLALGLFHIPGALRHQARLGVVAVAAVIFLGWPCKAFSDVLRARQRFALVAAAEVIGNVGLVVVVILLIYAVHAPLWVLIATGAGMPIFYGLPAAVIGLATTREYRFHIALLKPRRAIAFLRTSGYVMMLSITDLAIYQSDRLVLGAFRGASAVGLYEAAIRPHNLLRQFRASLSLTVLPASAGYLATSDVHRLRALLLRGTRYTMAATVPVTLVLMLLSKPILHVWLGVRYEAAAPALSILVSYFLFMSGISLMGSMLIAAQKLRSLAVYSWSTAIVNLALSLALTPLLGLNGVVLGTTVAYLVCSPILVRLALAQFDVGLGEYLRKTFLPSYATGLVLVGFLLVIRSAVSLNSLLPLAVVAVVSVLGYWTAFALICLSPDERAFVNSLIPGFRRGSRSSRRAIGVGEER